MFLWYPVLDLAWAPRRTARKKGSGYENEIRHIKQAQKTWDRIAFRSDVKNIYRTF
jgi:hypothetical protein